MRMNKHTVFIKQVLFINKNDLNSLNGNALEELFKFDFVFVVALNVL